MSQARNIPCGENGPCVWPLASHPDDRALVARALQLAGQSWGGHPFSSGTASSKTVHAVVAVGPPPQGTERIRLTAMLTGLRRPALLIAARDAETAAAWRTMLGTRVEPRVLLAPDARRLADELVHLLSFPVTERERSHGVHHRALLVLGASAGGQPILARILKNLPEPLSAPLIVCQHQPNETNTDLVGLLARATSLPVRAAGIGAQVESGTVWVAPSGRDTLITDGAGGLVFRWTRSEPHSRIHPSLDALLLGLPEAILSRTLVAVLTGMGQDGLEGARRVKTAGGVVIAQSRETCAVWGMPRSVVEAGLATAELDPEQIARAITRFLHSPAPRHPVLPEGAKNSPCAP